MDRNLSPATARWIHFGSAAQILPYLAELGISHVYLSPCLQAVPGSQHGYDVADPTRVSEDLGGEAAWKSFVQGARALGLRMLLDIVPNHMSASEHNPWWDDVLAHGPYSSFADYFDFRTVPDQPFRVHVCSLARAYGAAIEAGELKLEIRDGYPRVRTTIRAGRLSPVSWGSCCRRAEAIDNASANLERLQSLSKPDHRRIATAMRGSANAPGDAREARRAGALQARWSVVQTDPDRWTRYCNGNSSRCTVGGWAAS